MGSNTSAFQRGATLCKVRNPAYIYWWCLLSEKDPDRVQQCAYGKIHSQTQFTFAFFVCMEVYPVTAIPGCGVLLCPEETWESGGEGPYCMLTEPGVFLKGILSALRHLLR